MKLICLTFAMLTGFTLNLMAVPAAPFLITFAQPDGSTFQAHLKGDEYFSWIETENKQVLVQSKASDYFEFALLKRDEKNRLVLAPSGTRYVEGAKSVLRSESNPPNISREQLGKIWQSRIEAKRNIKLLPPSN
jgi:hypothetical protein